MVANKILDINFSASKAWTICFVSSLFFFYEFAQITIFNTIAPMLLKSFAFKASQLGVLSSFYSIANIAFLIPAGVLVDKYSSKKLMLMALSISIFGNILFSFAHSFEFAAFCRFISGIGGAFSLLCPLKLVSRWFSYKYSSFAASLVITIGMVGGIFSQTPIAILTNHVAWQDALPIFACIGVLFVLLNIIFVEDFPEDSKQTVKTSIKKVPLAQRLQKVLLNKQNILCSAYTSFMNLPIVLLASLWADLYLMQVQHLTKIAAADVTSMIFLGIIVGSPIFGWCSGKLASRKKPMLIAAIISCVISLLILFADVHQYVELLLLFFLLGLFSSGQVLGYPSVSESNPKHFVGTALSLVSIIVMLAGTILRPLFGFLMQLGWQGQMHHGVPVYSHHEFLLGLCILPLGFVLALLASLILRETYPEPY